MIFWMNPTRLFVLMSFGILLESESRYIFKPSNINVHSKDMLSSSPTSHLIAICVSGLGLDLVADHLYYDYCTVTPDWIILLRIVCIL